ncbi:hypothetical protein [Mycobacterium lepromatosis]|uniref:hypothetical protein n=1 Tax=Mycobacterium lepromatosis TaxID=480418 RepID=UPI0005F7FAA3|nr:hypothetical protein [Mycobacterium lepromatosis]UKN42591.1 hypothetical protein MLPF_2141 [Mycobacterium lepromatosis]
MRAQLAQATNWRVDSIVCYTPTKVTQRDQPDINRDKAEMGRWVAVKRRSDIRAENNMIDLFD